MTGSMAEMLFIWKFKRKLIERLEGQKRQRRFKEVF